MTPPRRRLDSLASAALVFVLAALLAIEARVAYATSITYDEYSMIAASVSDVVHGAHRFVLPYPPLGRFIVGETLVALGVRERSAAAVYEQACRDDLYHWGYGERLAREDNPDFRIPFAAPGLDSVTVAARLPMIPFALLGALVAFLWARDRWGSAGGLIALLLVATDADFLGHGGLAKFDTAQAATALACGFALDRVSRGRGSLWLGLLAAALAVTLGLRISGLFVVAGLVLATVALAREAPDPEPASVAHPFGQGTPRARARALGLAVLVVSALVLVAIAVFYRGENPIAAYARACTSYGPQARSERGSELAFMGTSGWRYFPYVVLLKKPLATLLLVALSLLVALRRGGRGRLGEELILAGPALVLALATCALAAPSGSRYMLPVLVFLYVGAGRLATWAGRSPLRWAPIVLLVACNVAGDVAAYPYFESATSVVAGPRVLAWRHLYNADLDWGGGLKALAEWQREHGSPPVVVVPYASQACRLVPDPRGGPDPAIVYGACWRLGDLRAYGVRGSLAGADVLFAPEKGRLYVVSAHVLAQANRLAEQMAAVRWRGAPPRLVLGGTVLPLEAIGGGCFLVFDLR